MNIQQIFKYLDAELAPEKGGKMQISINNGKEQIRIYIFSKEINSYSYIFSFTKETVDEKDIFEASIRSGYSGIDYKMSLKMDEALYQSIKDTLLQADAHYMKFLEAQLEAIGTMEDIDEVFPVDSQKETTDAE